MGSVSYKDFNKVEIRIGTVISAEVPEWSHWVMKLTVDFGDELGKKTIFAGMLGFYEESDFEGKQFPFIYNMEPKKIGPKGDVSEGMMLAASVAIEEPIEFRGETLDEKPVLFELQEKVPNGTRII